MSCVHVLLTDCADLLSYLIGHCLVEVLQLYTETEVTQLNGVVGEEDIGTLREGRERERGREGGRGGGREGEGGRERGGGGRERGGGREKGVDSVVLSYIWPPRMPHSKQMLYKPKIVTDPQKKASW